MKNNANLDGAVPYGLGIPILVSIALWVAIFGAYELACGRRPHIHASQSGPVQSARSIVAC
jgi:hypothetical protein